MWKSLGISEDSATGRLKKKMTRAMRRKRYDRLPLDPEHPGFAVRMPRKIKILKMGRKAKRNPETVVVEEEVRPPSLWGKVRDAYVNMMLKTADTASPTSVVPIAKRLDRSLTLGSGFGRKVEIVPTEANLGFKMTKMEKEYLDHLKKSFDSRYA